MGVTRISAGRARRMTGVSCLLLLAILTSRAQSTTPAMQAASSAIPAASSAIPESNRTTATVPRDTPRIVSAPILAPNAIPSIDASAIFSTSATKVADQSPAEAPMPPPNRGSAVPAHHEETYSTIIDLGAATSSTAGAHTNNGPVSTGLNAGQIARDQVLNNILNCPDQKLTYVPLPPIVAGGYTDVHVDDHGNTVAVHQNWDTSNPVATNKLLVNISTSIASSGSTSKWSLGSIFGLNTSNTQYVIDFMKYRLEPLTDTSDHNLGWARVGAGMRIVVNLTKDDGSASGGIWALAASVSASKVKGTMSTELIGMDSPETTAAMPFTVDLSDANIQKLVEALAIVKMKLYDPKTTVTPTLIATVKCSAPTPAQ